MRLHIFLTSRCSTSFKGMFMMTEAPQDRTVHADS